MLRNSTVSLHRPMDMGDLARLFFASRDTFFLSWVGSLSGSHSLVRHWGRSLRKFPLLHALPGLQSQISKGEVNNWTDALVGACHCETGGLQHSGAGMGRQRFLVPCPYCDVRLLAACWYGLSTPPQPETVTEGFVPRLPLPPTHTPPTPPPPRFKQVVAFFVLHFLNLQRLP